MRFGGKFDFLLVTVVISSFAYIAAQRLGTVPVPEGDEAYMSQVSYEMQYRNKVAVPMMRYLGGNIENAWHSRTPVYFLLLRGFTRVFGYGLTQGRAFNLITALATLLLVYLIGRTLFDWRAGLIAVVLLISDLTFLERSRLLRNDYCGAAMSMLAFLLFAMAQRRKRGWLYVASGLAAGAGVMCHTNGLYMLIAVLLLMLIDNGWRLIKLKWFYQFSVSALAVIGYEAIYAVVDYRNFRLQNRGDKLHFQVFEGWGWWDNVLRERVRYLKWIAGDSMFPSVPRTLLHLFQLLTVAAVVYLIINLVRRVRKGDALDDPRTTILLVTVVVTAFIAVVGGNKDIYYIAHLAPWFAVCAGVMLRDVLAQAGRLRTLQLSWARPAWSAALLIAALGTLAYGYALGKQSSEYLREVRNPDLISFDEVRTALRSVVPDALCPIAAKLPVMWLAFPEKDYCFASIEPRMLDAVDFDGKDYALITRRKNADFWAKDLDEQYHLLGELADTPYGNLQVYYTGVDPHVRAIEPQRFYFLHDWRGHVTNKQIASAHEVWSADPSAGSSDSAAGRAEESSSIETNSIELKPDTIYQAAIDLSSAAEMEMLIIDDRTGTWIKQAEIAGRSRVRSVEELFRTFGSGRVKVVIRPLKQNERTPIGYRRFVIREVAPV